MSAQKFSFKSAQGTSSPVLLALVDPRQKETQPLIARLRKLAKSDLHPRTIMAP